MAWVRRRAARGLHDGLGQFFSARQQAVSSKYLVDRTWFEGLAGADRPSGAEVVGGAFGPDEFLQGELLPIAGRGAGEQVRVDDRGRLRGQGDIAEQGELGVGHARAVDGRDRGDVDAEVLEQLGGVVVRVLVGEVPGAVWISPAAASGMPSHWSRSGDDQGLGLRIAADLLRPGRRSWKHYCGSPSARCEPRPCPGPLE